MNAEEKYRDWKQRRSTIDVGTDFADNAMNRIRTFEERNSRAAFVSYHIVDWIGAHPAAEAAANTVGIELAGSPYRGVSVNDCIKQARAAAARIAERLRS